MFEFATKNKLRFPFKGQISVEDLWDLSVRDLDTIFKSLNSELKESNEESLLAQKSKDAAILEVKIKIVRHIVMDKLEAAEKARKAKEDSEKKQKILAIISEKQDASLHDMSVEELQAMLENM